MGILQQAKKEEESETLAVINSAMRGLQREFDKDTLADSTALASSVNLFANSLGILGGAISSVSIELPNSSAESSKEVD